MTLEVGLRLGPYENGQRFLVNTAPGQTTEAIEVLMNWRPPH